MNKAYRDEYPFYLRSSRSFTFRDKFACKAFNHQKNYHKNNLKRILSYKIYFKNSKKKKRMAIYKVRRAKYE